MVETFGCTVDDVLRLLPGVTVTNSVTEVSNPAYRGTGRQVTRVDVEAFIASVATRVQARLWRFEATPDRFRENIQVMAKDLVATGAAHYVQSAVFPASASPNDGAAYADRLWQRFQTDLDSLATQVDTVIDNPPETTLANGSTQSGSPREFFPDEMRF